MAEPTAAEKQDLEELLQELRVALPGVQVLLAVLLTVPFSSGFDALGPQERIVFLGAILGAAIATVLLIAPSAHHRFAWPASDQGIERLIRIGTIEARLGMLALAWTITAACYVVVDADLRGSRGPAGGADDRGHGADPVGRPAEALEGGPSRAARLTRARPSIVMVDSLHG